MWGGSVWALVGKALVKRIVFHCEIQNLRYLQMIAGSYSVIGYAYLELRIVIVHSELGIIHIVISLKT